MCLILQRLGAIEILHSAQDVCSSWRRLIDMRNFGEMYALYCDLKATCTYAVDLSCGQLIDINIEFFGTDKLLQYIARRYS
ncbi:unnamed protein product [Citrullus colocynthis]|uniref:F-box domain-containing protein n=1 Tax=Citrullus colocynthis TaxID=252529 RepID=A0ABP0YL58_9ROSI